MKALASWPKKISPNKTASASLSATKQDFLWVPGRIKHAIWDGWRAKRPRGAHYKRRHERGPLILLQNQDSKCVNFRQEYMPQNIKCKFGAFCHVVLTNAKSIKSRARSTAPLSPSPLHRDCQQPIYKIL